MEIEVVELPYRAEYAKSGRASCRGCKSPIAQGTLRLAVMVQSPMWDGRQPHWYHMMCFFSKQKPRTVGDIEHFQDLRFEDQEKIKEKIESGSSMVLPSNGKKGKKRGGGGDNSALKDFTLEYSKSSRATCRGCELKIMKADIRISKKDYESDVGRRYGGQDMWHHLDCFAKLRSELLYFDKGENLPGFNTLSKEDQKIVKEKLPAVKQEDLPPSTKKIKAEPKDEVDAAKESEDDKEYKKQNQQIFKYRDLLKRCLSKKEMILLLEENNQEIPPGEDRILDRLSDIMTFGNLEPCGECGGQLVFRSANNSYVCTGDASEWSKCMYKTTEPKRKPFVVPKEFRKEHPFLEKYKCKPKKRIIKVLQSTVAVKKEEEHDGPKIKKETPPLYNMEFVLHKTVGDKDEIKKRIQKLGGKVSTKMHKNLAAVISVQAEVDRMGSRIAQAKDYDIQIIPESILDDIETGTDIKGAEIIKSKSICDWGSDPLTRIPEMKSGASKSKSKFGKSISGKVTVKVKGAGAVDPDSGLEDKAHIYQKGNDKYNAVLGLTDIQMKKNSYYKMQLLEADKKNKFWVFRSWGRIGTTIGTNKLEQFDTLKEAIDQYKIVYEERTGNSWDNRDYFVKVPGRYYPIDVDYGEDSKKNLTMADTGVPSKLQPPVQELIRMIFDIDAMKKTMLEFEIDLEKMPLGKISAKQIQKAFAVLSELQDLIKGNKEKLKLIDANNRFYTLIPHNFGQDSPHIIETEEAIKVKTEMLDNLMELEIAYNLLNVDSVEGENPLDAHYMQLKTDIEILDKESEEFNIIDKYVKNTHAETHTQYELEIMDIFKVKRQGEDKRFKPFRKLPNRKLLWHGSRTTNFAGILSQGLRIAPPEAPVTGYMFGKGIYFADMVSKSAQYCCTSRVNPVGLLLLCDVALGNMYELTSAKNVTKLPSGKHSVKGIGMTQPDPSSIHKLPDGVEVPFGSGVKDSKVETSLLYNEFIVYDVAQVNVKYLLKLNFKHKFG